jgi:aminoglycoside phosphotransferase (APT) family kinase protein
MFRLGEHLSVRLPSAERYAAAVEKEHVWLPRFSALLPLTIPLPIAIGEPDEGYLWRWSVYRWLEGETATTANIADLNAFATTLADFLVALWRIDPAGGPPAGAHCFFRGASLDVYNDQTRQAIAALGDRINGKEAQRIWDAALAVPYRGEPVWFHGDVAITNLLTRNGRLDAVIDFGTSGVGDPACDLAIAWTFFSAESRRTFRSGTALDTDAWARGRGWALWKALIVLAQPDGSPLDGQARTIWTHNPLTGRSVVDEVIEEAANSFQGGDTAAIG